MSSPIYVVLDTETTGLDRMKDQPVEVAWWGYTAQWGWGDVQCLVLPHDRPVSSEADAVNGYFKRGLFDVSKHASRAEIGRLHQELSLATIVGQNPSFDTSMLSKLFTWVSGGFYDDALEAEPWRRTIDIGSVAYGLGYRAPNGGPAGLKHIADRLRSEGHPIPEPDHTATGDVLATAAVFKVLCPF